MSVEAITWAIRFDAQNATEKAILLVLANYASGDGECFPGQQSIAKQAACGERTVRRILDSLEERGVIRRDERRRRDGTRSSDTIILVDFQQAANMSGSRSSTGHPVQTNRPSCPDQPATVAGPTTFEPSGDTSGDTARVRTPPPTDFKIRFDEFWKAFPDGPNKGSPKLAMSHFRRLWLDDGVDPERLIRAAKAYAETRDDPKYAHAGWRWLNDGHWEAMGEAEAVNWLARVAYFQHKGEWPWLAESPQPDRAGCLAPPDVLEAYGYTPGKPDLRLVGKEGQAA